MSEHHSFRTCVRRSGCLCVGGLVCHIAELITFPVVGETRYVRPATLFFLYVRPLVSALSTTNCCADQEPSKIAVFIRILFGYEACFLGPMLSRVGTSWTKPLFTSPCSPSTQLSTFSVDDDFRVVAAVAVHSAFAYRLRVLTLSNAPTLLRSCCSQAGWQT